MLTVFRTEFTGVAPKWSAGGWIRRLLHSPIVVSTADLGIAHHRPGWPDGYLVKAVRLLEIGEGTGRWDANGQVTVKLRGELAPFAPFGGLPDQRQRF